MHAAYWLSLSGLTRSRNAPAVTEQPSTIVAIIKVLCEERTISTCVAYWREVLKRFPTLQVAIVGSDSERIDGRNRTLIAAKTATGEEPRICILEAPSNIARSAAGQLNYAISCIEHDPATTWLLFCDVDTRYAQSGLEEIIDRARGESRFIQQSGLFLSNFNHISYWQKGHALYQSRWTISHELLRLGLYDATGVVLAHVVGHGLCARLDAIREYGGFPDFGSAEDIELGFYLVCSGERIISCRELDSSDNPISVWRGLAQEFSWSHAARDYPLYWIRFRKHHRRIHKTRKLRSLLMLTQGVALYLNWLVSSWVVAIALAYAASGSTLATAFLGLYLLDFILCTVIFARLQRVPLLSSVSALPALVVATLRRSLPADYGLIRTIIGLQRRKYKSTHEE